VAQSAILGSPLVIAIGGISRRWADFIIKVS